MRYWRYKKKVCVCCSVGSIKKISVFLKTTDKPQSLNNKVRINVNSRPVLGQRNWELAACPQLLRDGEIRPPQSCHDKPWSRVPQSKAQRATNCIIVSYQCSEQAKKLRKVTSLFLSSWPLTPEILSRPLATPPDPHIGSLSALTIVYRFFRFPKLASMRHSGSVGIWACGLMVQK